MKVRGVYAQCPLGDKQGVGSFFAPSLAVVGLVVGLVARFRGFPDWGPSRSVATLYTQREYQRVWCHFGSWSSREFVAVYFGVVHAVILWGQKVTVDKQK